MDEQQDYPETESPVKVTVTGPGQETDEASGSAGTKNENESRENADQQQTKELKTAEEPSTDGTHGTPASGEISAADGTTSPDDGTLNSLSTKDLVTFTVTAPGQKPDEASGSGTKNGNEPRENAIQQQTKEIKTAEEASTDGTRGTPASGEISAADGTSPSNGSTASEDRTINSLSTKDLLGHRRESVALQELDRKHSWLSEMEEKGLNVETAFISKIQYVAISNHFKKYIDELQSKDEQVPAGIVGELSNLFDKFRTCFAGSQRLRHKLMEMGIRESIRDAESRRLKSNLREMEKKMRETEEHLGGQVAEKMRMQREMSDLREEVRDAERRVEEKDSDIASTSLKDETEEAEEKIRSLQEQLDSLKSEIEFSREREVIFQERLAEGASEKSSLNAEMTSLKSELQQQISRREKAEKKVEEGVRRIREEEEKVEELREELSGVELEVEVAKGKHKSVLMELRETQKDFEATSQTLSKIRKELDIRDDRLKLLDSENDSVRLQLKERQIEVKSLKVNLSSLIRQNKELTRKLALLEDKNKELETRIENQQEISITQQTRMNALDKEHKENESKVKELTKEKINLTGDLIKLEQTIINLRSEAKVRIENLSSVRKALESSELKIEELEDAIKTQVNAKERIAADAHRQKLTISNLKSELKRVEQLASQSEKTISQLRQELGEEVDRCKKMLEDQKYFRKNIAESKRTIEQKTDQITILEKHVLQLKSYNQNLDERRKQLVQQNSSVSDQLSSLRESLKQEVKTVESLVAKLKVKEGEEQSLLKRISDLEEDVNVSKRTLKKVSDEKDVMVGRLREKDREVSSGKEMVERLEKDVELLEKSLEDSGEDVKVLKLQLAEMCRRREVLERKVENAKEVKDELGKAKRELKEKEVLAKGVEAEMQRPINLHRWRILEGTDPTKSQLIGKTLSLQNQLSRNRSELLAKETELREKEKLVEKLHEKLQKRSSENEASDQLRECRLELEKRMGRMKCLQGENNMYENLVRKYREEAVAMRDELRKYKEEEWTRSTKKRKSGK